MTLTITHQGSSSASGIAGGLPSTGSEGLDAGNMFGSLLAALFSLTAPQGEAPKLPKLTNENIEALSNALLALQQSLETDAPIDGAASAPSQTETSPLELIANLIETLKTLSETSEKGVTLNPGAIERASSAIDTITQLLDAASQGKTTAPNGTPTNAGTVLATDTPEAPLPATAQLTRLAEALKQAAPELSAKLEQLATKLQQLAQPAIVQTANGDDADLNQLLQSLIGEKQVTGAKANLPLDGEKTLLRGLDSAPQKTSAPIEAPKLDLATTKALANDAKPANSEQATVKADAPATSLAGAAASSAPTAKTERGPLSDPLLLAQAGAQSSTRADTAIAIKPVTSAYQAQTQTPNLPGIAFEIARHHAAGLSKFQIRMDPPEMGKIDVRLNVDTSGNLHAKLTVERAETLDLLQRDSRTLEKALQQAGLDNRSTNLEFSLRQNPFARQDGQSGQGNSGDAQQFSLTEEDETPITNLPPPTYYRGTAAPGGINMFA